MEMPCKETRDKAGKAMLYAIFSLSCIKMSLMNRLGFKIGRRKKKLGPSKIRYTGRRTYYTMHRFLFTMGGPRLWLI